MPLAQVNQLFEQPVQGDSDDSDDSDDGTGGVALHQGHFIAQGNPVPPDLFQDGPTNDQREFFAVGSEAEQIGLEAEQGYLEALYQEGNEGNLNIHDSKLISE